MRAALDPAKLALSNEDLFVGKPVKVATLAQNILLAAARSGRAAPAPTTGAPPRALLQRQGSRGPPPPRELSPSQEAEELLLRGPSVASDLACGPASSASAPEQRKQARPAPVEEAAPARPAGSDSVSEEAVGWPQPPLQSSNCGVSEQTAPLPSSLPLSAPAVSGPAGDAAATPDSAPEALPEASAGAPKGGKVAAVFPPKGPSGTMPPHDAVLAAIAASSASEPLEWGLHAAVAEAGGEVLNAADPGVHADKAFDSPAPRAPQRRRSSVTNLTIVAGAAVPRSLVLQPVHKCRGIRILVVEASPLSLSLFSFPPPWPSINAYSLGLQSSQPQRLLTHSR